MVEEFKIYDERDQSITRIIKSSDIENVDPIKYYMDYSVNSYISKERDLLLLKFPSLASELDFNFFYKRAKQNWDKRFETIMNTEVSNNFFELLENKSRKEQSKLLKNQTLNTYQLSALLFKAYLNYKFTFSQYIAELFQKGLDKSSLPLLVEINEGNVKSIGTTTLSDGQLKQAIEQRKVIIAKFLDKENCWHCFITTFNSLAGKEKWNEGQAHFHYISDRWGIPREEVIKQIKKGNYPSTSVHIGIEDLNNDLRLRITL